MANSRHLAEFEGRWHLRKRIVQHGQEDAQFEGTATWQAAPDGLIYDEVGHLQIGASPPLQATRRYVWRAGLEVYFDDGRFFHTVPATGGRAHHACPPDDYVVTYDFDNWPVFTAQWQVSGPRKAYQMTASYRPVAASAG